VETSGAAQDEGDGPAGEDALTRLEGEIQALASTEISRIQHGSGQLDSPERIFERAAVLKENAMGIIYNGDGSSDTERVGRLLALIPALLTVVDEARDTISRLRDLANEPDAPKLISPYDARGASGPERPNWGRKDR
jgi:hypothetical protein